MPKSEAHKHHVEAAILYQPPRGNLCSTLKPFSSSYGFWYICYFFLNLYWICYNIASMCWFSGQEACGILVPWPGIEPELGGKVLTTEPPGMSLWYIYHKINPVTIVQSGMVIWMSLYPHTSQKLVSAGITSLVIFLHSSESQVNWIHSYFVLVGSIHMKASQVAQW